MSHDYLKRYALLFCSLFVNAFGVVFITKAALGTSPISGVPYVMSLASPLSFGATTFLLNLLFILIEVSLMGWRKAREKRFELLVQFPVLLVFSSSIDFSMFVLRNYVPETYSEMLASLFFGCAILATGIGWAVKAHVAMNPGEYVVQVIASKTGKPFGNVKLCFDATLVLLAALLSLLFMRGIHGLREGTFLAALLVGPMERLSYPLWRIFDRWLQPAR